MSVEPIVTRRAAAGVRADPATDHELVSAVRRGDDRAFEQLYTRYQRRIGSYVCGMVKDHARAEDITQEVFVSALRRMRETERPIAFKPWIYEIARNACIDSYRRSRRAVEVSYDADDRLSPADHGRLVATGPQPDAAVDAKQELDRLCGAFGGLSDSHHEILVMRELEGRSYADIGERMGMSRAAVESTLFRARKRLGEEYDELASGARCLRIEAIIAAGDARVGARDQRTLARHISHCQPCRRLAAQAGLEIALPARRRLAERIAAWLPLPAFLRPRRGGDEAASAAGGGGGWLAHAPSFAEAFNSGWSKAAAGLAALVVAGAGVGVTTHAGGDKRDERATGVRAAEARTAPGGDAAAASPLRSTVDHRATGATAKPRRAGRQHGRDGGSAAGSGAGTQPSGGGGGESLDASAPSTGQAPSGDSPGVDLPATNNRAIDDTVDTVTNAAKPVTDAAQPVTDAAQPVTDAAQPVTDAAQPVTDAAQPVTDAVDGATGGLPTP